MHLARVLHIEDLTEFLGWQAAPTPPAPDAAGTAGTGGELRAALLEPLCARLTGVGRTGTPVSVPLLGSELVAGWEQWQSSSCRREELAVVLPRMLQGLRTARRQGGHGAELATLLSRAYGLARYVAEDLNAPHLAWVAAERCMSAVEHSTELAEHGAVAVHRCASLLAMHYPAEAYRYAVCCADQMVSPDTVPIKGQLLLQAAEACAALNQRQEALRLLTMARRIADEIGSTTSGEFIHFGPSEVDLQEIRITLHLGQFDSAMRLIKTMQPAQEGPISTRMECLIMMAHVYMRMRDDLAAVFALNRVATTSPGDLQYNTYAHKTIQQLARRGHALLLEDLTKLSEIAYQKAS